jgi:hypothetical protein
MRPLLAAQGAAEATFVQFLAAWRQLHDGPEHARMKLELRTHHWQPRISRRSQHSDGGTDDADDDDAADDDARDGVAQYEHHCKRHGCLPNLKVVQQLKQVRALSWVLTASTKRASFKDGDTYIAE